MTRRELLSAGAFGAAAGGEQTVASDPRLVREIERRLDDIRRELALMNSGSFTGTEVAADKIRDQMVLFLRANQKYPDFLEVGYLVFHSVYDWHIRNRLPLSVGRSADGRYGLTYMFTRLILRTDAVPEFIGLPYDQRA